MTTYVTIETPLEDGRIRNFKMVPPPGGTQQNQVLVWNVEKQEPEWRNFADLGIVIGAPTTYAPLVTDEGKYLLTDTGARLVAFTG